MTRTFALMGVFMCVMGSGCGAEDPADVTRLAAEMLSVTDASEQASILDEVWGLSDDDLDQVHRELRRLGRASEVREAEASAEHGAIESQAENDECVAMSAEQIARERWYTSLYRLSGSVQDRIFVEASQSSCDSTSRRALSLRCPVNSFPLSLGGISTTRPTLAAYQATDVSNGNDWVCDYQLWYNRFAARVTGSTARATALIGDFGGRLSARNEATGTTAIVGFGRASLRGMNRGAVQQEIRLVP